jgi:ParB family chromosome partitioning protein
MARLDIRKTAGWNAGRNYYATPFNIADIVIDPEISKIFAVSDRIFDEIVEKMRASGYDKSQPVVIWKGENILLDGHTRLAAAKELELETIPALEMEFDSREEALLYTFERQAVRRNLSSAEILQAARMLHGRKEKDGKGRAAELLAERLGVSAATVYQAKKIIQEAPEEDLAAVQSGDRSIKSVYEQITKKRPDAGEKPEGKTPDKPPDKPVSSPGMPDNRQINFLKNAVVVLVDNGQAEAALLLVRHFAGNLEDAKDGFYRFLPETVREKLLNPGCST